jgi:hypothetical protein
MDEPEPPPGRRQEIRQRIGAIRTRIDELKAKRQGATIRGTFSERLAAAQRHMAASEADAQHAVAASIHAFRRAAEAHQRVARQHDRAAEAASGGASEHERQAAVHRTAATADTQRADHAQSRLPDETGHGARGPDQDQELSHLLHPAGARRVWTRPGRSPGGRR